MHGTFKGGPPRRGRGPGSGPGLRLALRLILREAAVGCVLYAVLGRDPRLNALLCSLVWIALATRRSGLLDRKGGFGLLTECLVVFCGGLVFRNLLLVLRAVLAHPS